jgi:hypothetical protein
LRLVAQLDDSFHAHIFAYFWCPKFTDKKARPIHLIVDTGCTTTTILGDDMTRLGINCDGLKSTEPTTTANGVVVPFIMEDVRFIMEFRNGLFNFNRKFRRVDMSEIHCHCPTDPRQMTEEKLLHVCSLLGMDFLHFFKKWTFKDNFLHLET